MGDKDGPDYMDERVFQRNRLPPRAYFLPAEHLSLSGKWRFHYALSPLEPEPEPGDDGAWALIDVPGKLISRLLSPLSSGKLSYNCLLASAKHTIHCCFHYCPEVCHKKTAKSELLFRRTCK